MNRILFNNYYNYFYNLDTIFIISSTELLLYFHTIQLQVKITHRKTHARTSAWGA